MNEEIDLYADVDKVHSQEYYDQKHPSVKESNKVSIYIGNLTWWTSDYELEMFIKQQGILDLVEVNIHENSTNGQSKGFALVHLGSESSAKILMDKLPKQKINGLSPMVTPANEISYKQFENATQKSRERPEHKESENGKSTTAPPIPSMLPPNMPPNMPGMPPVMPPGMPGMPPMTPPSMPPGGVPMPPGFPPTHGFPASVPPPGFPPSMPIRPPQLNNHPPMPPGFPPMPPGMIPNFNMPNFANNAKKEGDPDDEECMNKNQQITSSAIQRSIEDSAAGDYSSAIETLLNAISLIKQSKVSKNLRAKAMISSLQDCLHGIEEKSFGASASRRDSDRKKRDRRDRSRDRSRSRERDRDMKRRRSRSRERRRSEYDDRR